MKNNCRVIYVHANLGNGKTIFAECLKHLFEDEGYQIFTLKTVYMKSLPTDVQHIVESPGKKLVIIENYYNYINVLEKFAFYSLEDVQFILTARTVLYDTRIREANEILKVGEGESKVIDLNKLNEKELNVMSNILRNNGSVSYTHLTLPTT